MAKPSDTVAEPKVRRAGPLRFLREVIRELGRVRWPNRREVINYTTAALVTCIVLGLLVWGFDVGISKLMSLIGVL